MVGKFGRDISLLMQPEVGEAFEPHAEGRGGSSAMPHKRNPVACMHMLDAAYRAPALALTLTGELTAEHERGLGSWPNALPVLADLFMLADNSLDAAVEVAEGLRVEPHAMQSNLDRMHGVVFSEGVALLLTRKLGSKNAQRIVSELCNEASARHVDLRDLAGRHAEVRAAATGPEIDAACSQAAHLDAAQAMCTAVLEAWRTGRNFC
jgi:3-carboxy-cis,cis-muconate cycloisomerase